MARLSVRYAVALACLATAVQAHSKGMFNIHPYINTDVIYDDNVFRFASDQQADVSGLEKSDIIKALTFGANAQLELSRQVLTASARVSENKYSRNSFLDYRGQQFNVRWNWRVGSDWFGQLSIDDGKSISGFNNNNARVQNIVDSDSKTASINWLLKPRLALYGLLQERNVKNSAEQNIDYDRKDEIYEVGLRYTTRLNNEVSFFYRNVDTNYPKRSVTISRLFGDQADSDQYGISVRWLPTAKLRLTSILSNVKFSRAGAEQDGYDGFNIRNDLTYLITKKVTLGFNLFKETSQVDFVDATYVELEGVGFNGTWNLSNKTSLKAGINYLRRSFRGNTILINSASSQVRDERFGANLSLSYRPLDDALLQIRYRYADREANRELFEFEYNRIDFLAEYLF